MRRQRKSFQQLIQSNKEELLTNKKEIDKIDDKVDKKLMIHRKEQA
ncbi:FbpB family small basic protein [Pontibacillus salicampi]|uniref:FbpB family small basic protein n=1 Tax=Pontibacillus salicampi TaxID=1449801 RepID=A0ABV6LQF0_9BACI